MKKIENIVDESGILLVKDAIEAGKRALAEAGKLEGTIRKEIYVPKKIINIVVG